MATLTITKAEQSGRAVRIAGWVDEGLAGIVTYTAEDSLRDLRELDTPLKRLNLLKAALTEVRNDQLKQDAIDGQLGNLIGNTVEI
jgi:hypothetical protein